MVDSSFSAFAGGYGISPLPSTQLVEVGYGASLTDIHSFEQSLSKAEARIESSQKITAPSAAENTVMKPLDSIDGEAAEIARYAKSAIKSGNELTPSEVVILTAKSQEFMFHAQLTANIANRTSEGLQQLFRQQS
jgi:hypothetical protein